MTLNFTKIVWALGLMLFCHFSFCQEKPVTITDGKIKYKVVKDGPIPYPIVVTLSPFVELGASSDYAGLQLASFLDYNRKWAFNIELRGGLKNYGFKNSNYDSFMVTKKGNPISPRYIELTGQYNFSDRQVMRKIMVPLDGEGGDRFVKIPGHMRQVWSVRGGVYYFANNFKIGRFDFVTGSDNSVYGVNMNNNQDTIYWASKQGSRNGSSTNNAYSVVSGAVLTAGLSFRRSAHLAIKVKKEGEKVRSYQKEMYLDFQFAPAIFLSNVAATDNTEFDVKTLDGVKKYTGWRYGWIIRAAKIHNTGFKFEVGQRPGIKTSYSGRFFINLSCGFSMPFKSKYLKNNN